MACRRRRRQAMAKWRWGRRKWRWGRASQPRVRPGPDPCHFVRPKRYWAMACRRPWERPINWQRPVNGNAITFIKLINQLINIRFPRRGGVWWGGERQGRIPEAACWRNRTARLDCNSIVEAIGLDNGGWLDCTVTMEKPNWDVH